jgi:DNA polymerase-3 subunit gamma/tau
LLATTEIHKVPDTVLSRVIRFDLEKIGESDMNTHLKYMCQEEGIKAEDAAISMITYRARGSLRDAITILEKCIYENAVTSEYVEQALHLVNHRFLRETFEALKSGKAEKIQYILDTISKEGTDVRQFASQMTEWIVDNI